MKGENSKSPSIFNLLYLLYPLKWLYFCKKCRDVPNFNKWLGALGKGLCPRRKKDKVKITLKGSVPIAKALGFMLRVLVKNKWESHRGVTLEWKWELPRLRLTCFSWWCFLISIGNLRSSKLFLEKSTHSHFNNKLLLYYIVILQISSEEIFSWVNSANWEEPKHLTGLF